MDLITRRKIELGLAWWAFTAVVCALIYFKVNAGMSSYPHFYLNMAAIVALITLTRWIFLLPQSFISGSYAAMALFAVLMVPVFFYFLGGYREVKMFWDSGEVIPLVRGENFDDKMKMAGFYRQELMFFILGSMVASVVLPFRLVRAAWRKYNLHKV